MTAAAVLALADGRILTGRMALDAKLIDAFGGELEAIAWLESEKNIGEDLKVLNYFPFPKSGLERFVNLVGGEAGAALGLETPQAMALDGLVSLWQADRAQ